ncbi:OTU domain-containing protein 6B-like [Limulus polyphemus]|uniref:OTU domain-containing protein 6B-like n=1 Tax=Limulus polyphemus TaxID=6850 RepID=A0ABM1BJK6_LIMPO|nr:OTU domain-containing protein 6B-like [Limulus polyphemus]
MTDEHSIMTAKDRLLQVQKQEKKVLQARIQDLKHSVPKGDKKKKKEVAVQIATLEEEMAKKHESELRGFESSMCEEKVEEMTENVGDLTVSGNPQIDHLTSEKQQKITRSQKRREKKANEERVRKQRIEEQERENLTGVRNVEAEKLKEILANRKLAIYEIPSDGNCLYKAVEHQLKLSNIETSVPILREQTANYLREHSTDYLPFLTSAKMGDFMTEDELEEYCNEIANTSAWGGLIELRIISHVFQTPIEVIQADGPSIIIGEEYISSPLILSYHRHVYQLGEHYNSVIPAAMVEEEKDE